MSLGTQVWLINKSKTKGIEGSIQVAFSGVFFKWKLLWKSANVFSFLISFWGKTIHPISPEAEAGFRTSKPRQSDEDQMSKVKWVICYFMTFFFIGGLFPF